MKSVHKRLFLVVIVVLPMWWLLFTDDGKRRSDTLMLWMAGGDPIDLNFKALNRDYSVAEWKQVFSDIEWNCEAKSTSFGDHYCYSEISSYNGVPARYLTVFFADDHVHAVKLVYRNQYHQQMGADLHQQLGLPDRSRPLPSSEEDLLQWKTDYGKVLIKAGIRPEEEASLLWISH